MKANQEVETAGPASVPAPQAGNQEPGNQEPRTRDEKYMAALWVEIIGLEPDTVRLRDKFVEVGGNSLTLNIILNRIEADTGAAIPAELFFEDDSSSLSALASELETLRAAL